MTTIFSTDARYAHTSVNTASMAISASVANLTSGQKKDANVADLAVGTILASRVNTLRVAIGNAGQATNLLNTAKGGLDTILSLLQQQIALATKASDASLSDTERSFLNLEFKGLTTEINAISTNTNFNGVKLLDGSISGAAGAKTATGMQNENYSLINSSQYSVAGTAVDGNYVNTASGNFGSNTLTFATTATATGTNVLTLTDAGGKYGATTGASAITYSVTNGDSAAKVAASFVAAAKADTGVVARQFNFIDNGDGTVQVVARSATADVQGVTFGLVAGTTPVVTTVSIGNDGTTPTSIGSAQAFNTKQNTSAAGVTGSVGVIQAANVGVTASSNTINITTAPGGNTIKLQISDSAGSNTQDIVSYLASASDTTATTALKIAALANASTSDYARRFTFSASGSNITVTSNELGTSTSNDALKFNMDAGSGTLVANLAGTNVVVVPGSSLAFNTSGVGFTRGTTASVSDATQTYNANMQGAISGMTATYTAGTGDSNNTVQFSAIVGGQTYKSQVVNLYSSTAGSGVTSDTILANTKLIFTNPSGAVNANGVLTDAAFQINVGSSAITLASVANQGAGKTSADTVAAGIQAQVKSLSINQSRSLSLVSSSANNYKVTSAVGTMLAGLVGFNASGGSNNTQNAAGDIQISANNFAADGTNGSVGSFTVDNDKGTITTTLNGQKYTAYLSSTNVPKTGGAQVFGVDANGATNNGTYNVGTKLLSLVPTTGTPNYGNQAKLIFYSDSTADANTITVNLGNVSKTTTSIDISTTNGANALATALNGVFGVSSNDSLNFQVGAVSTDAIGVSIGSASSSSIYKNATGDSIEIIIDSSENATTANNVLKNAVNNVTSLEATVSAAISSFRAAIQAGNSSMQNAEASRSVLLDTDYTSESTNFAEARVRVDAATAVLSQINSRVQGLLSLLRQ